MVNEQVCDRKRHMIHSICASREYYFRGVRTFKVIEVYRLFTKQELSKREKLRKYANYHDVSTNPL